MIVCAYWLAGCLMVVVPGVILAFFSRGIVGGIDIGG